MDATSFLRTEVGSQAITMAVYRQESTRSYGSDSRTNVGTTDVSVAGSTASSEVNPEGTDAEITFVGMIDPTDNTNEPLEVGDELRVVSNEAKRYVVETKEGLPNDLTPDLVRVGLRTANESD